MRRITAWLLLAACAAPAAFAQEPPAVATNLTVPQVVERNAAARGGLDAWHKIQTMAWGGHVESSNSPERKLSFLLEQKRPNVTRFEIIAEGQKSVRTYDGTNGWKLRPNGGGKPELQPYTADELRFARGAQVIEGPLMDYAAKGANITLGGVADAEGRKAYVLNVALPSGGNHRVWVDAETFLELRHDREFRNALGQPALATVLYRNYRMFEGLQIPLTIETGAAAGNAMNRLIIERVALNPPLEDKLFARPTVPTAKRNGVAVDTRGPATASAMRPAPQP